MSCRNVARSSPCSRSSPHLQEPSQGLPGPLLVLQQFGVCSWGVTSHHSLSEPLLINLQSWSSSDPAGKCSSRDFPPWEMLNIDQDWCIPWLGAEPWEGSELQCDPGTAPGVGKGFGFDFGSLPVLHPLDFYSPGAVVVFVWCWQGRPHQNPLHYLSADLIELLSLTSLLRDLYPPLVLPSLPS